MRRSLSLSVVILTLFSLDAEKTNADIIFTDWTSIDTANDVAVGTLGPAGVTLSGNDINDGITNGSATVFNYSHFTPILTTSDVVYLLGANPPASYTYTVSFTTPVTNPRLHIYSLASMLIFDTNLTKISGQDDFVVAGNSVTGALHDFPADPTDSNGTIELPGIFSAFTFSAQGIQVFTGIGDGIGIQIGLDTATLPEPGSLACLLAGAVIMTCATRRQRFRVGSIL